MSTLETRLRALHDDVCPDEIDGDGCIDQDCPDRLALRAAAATGDGTGYARGMAEAYEDAARLADGYPIATEPCWQRTVEVVGAIVDKLRARAAAKRTEGGER